MLQNSLARLVGGDGCAVYVRKRTDIPERPEHAESAILSTKKAVRRAR